ncbi:MAG: hypothetical protein M3040_11115, partial [Bacteroidota bacterium]|nr:hypothetical protein [Bacteroidota bacterium]
TLGNNNKAVVNGVASPLKLKKNIVVINLENEKVEQNDVEHVKIWIDIDAGRSIRKNGAELEFEPGVNAFSKDKAGSIEGRIMPLDARAVVMSINGTDTSTAKPGREGEFKIVGLKAGNYKLVVHSTNNTYADAVMLNVPVHGKEDSQIGTITLHK